VPLRVVLDRTLRVSPQARLFSRPGASMVFTACRDDARRAQFERQSVSVESAATDGAGLALEPILRRLAELEANEVWVEAGAQLAGALLRAGLVDELIVYIAPTLLGPDARALVELPALEHLEQRLRLQFIECVRIGEDLRVTCRALPAQMHDDGSSSKAASKP
jgi:diaminohydroxyphosphoribosylaminopyrimidine deaminase/5-amino-6-(5-phosphoribosylamino)uracil reductase